VDRSRQAGTGNDTGERRRPDCLDEDQALAYAFGDGGNTLPQDLAAHLDGCPRCQTLVAEAARAHFASEASIPRGGHSARTLRDQELVLGRYEIVRFIGAGGMGEVYEAVDRELGERIALKTVALTTLDSQRAVGRLKAEVQLARRTTHPNVCRIFDFGVHLRTRAGVGPEPIPLLTMELLAGETLAHSLRRSGPVTVAQARPIVHQILQGLAAVHAAQIVHRDLKAENVFLVGGDAGPRVVLMDFGLARPALPSGPGSFSIHHTLVGTASYMAPEQVEGRPVSFASDVYAVGVLLFEMLTGRLPFVGETAMEVAVRRLQEPPPRPSSLVPDLDPVWEQAILRCLARAPADRFQTVAALAEALDQMTVVSPRRAWPAMTAGLALALAAGAGVWMWRPQPPPGVRAASTAPRPHAPEVVQEPPVPMPATAAAPAAPVKPSVEQPVRPTIVSRPRHRRVHHIEAAPVAAPAALEPEPAPRAAPKPPAGLLHPDGIVDPFSKAR
jgi:hypothetical protein